MTPLRRRARARLLVLLAALVTGAGATTACGSGEPGLTGVVGDSAGATLSIVSGNDQTVPAGTTAAALTVRVLDAAGLAVPDVAVTWAIASGAGQLDATSSATNASGVASMTFTAGANAGTSTVTARATRGTTATFTITVTATQTP